MFTLSESFPAPIRNSKIGEFASDADAIAAALNLGAIYLEPDADNAGCFDALTRDGRILTIEPTDRAARAFAS